MNLDWYFGFLPKRRLVMFYDQLKENPEHELQRLVDFLHISVSNRTMHCVMDKREGIYKRTKRLMNFNPFDESMKTMLNQRQKFVYDILLGKSKEMKQGARDEVAVSSRTSVLVDSTTTTTTTAGNTTAS